MNRGAIGIYRLCKDKLGKEDEIQQMKFSKLYPVRPLS